MRKYTVHKSNDIICVRCAKACNENLCEWVKYLTSEHIPKGAKYYIHRDTQNIHITDCPQLIFGRNGDKFK